MNLTVQAPINAVSFGFCTYNILRELWKRQTDVSWFPIGYNVMDPKFNEMFNGSLTSFNKREPEFVQWLQGAAQKAYASYKATNPTLKFWHIRGAEEQYGRDQYLFTFHELDTLTPIEVNILNNQRAVMVSSLETKAVFEQYGVTVPVHYVPLGYDVNHFYATNRRAYPDNVTCWSIGGKFEHRKHTAKTIKTWIKRFGGNREHVLHTMVWNVFLPSDERSSMTNSNQMSAIWGGQKPFNINPLPYTATLGELNDAYNVADIAIDMSGSEGWSLPSFHTVGLGKHAIVHNCSAMKGWANDANAVLVEPTGKEPVYDNVFFAQGQPFNQGNIYTWQESDLLSAFDHVIEKRKLNKVNDEGLRLKEQFTWAKTTDAILSVIQS